jgi:hypothetical protein
VSHVGVNLGFGTRSSSPTSGTTNWAAAASLELFAKEVMPGARELQG